MRNIQWQNINKLIAEFCGWGDVVIVVTGNVLEAWGNCPYRNGVFCRIPEYHKSDKDIRNALKYLKEEYSGDDVNEATYAYHLMRVLRPEWEKCMHYEYSAYDVAAALLATPEQKAVAFCNMLYEKG
jgi:hypothetical protein